MSKYTAEQVRDAMIAEGITRVDHHYCGVCGTMVFYSRQGEQLYFNPACGCGGWSAPEPRDWSDAVDWINAHSVPEWREKIAASFGLTPICVQ